MSNDRLAREGHTVDYIASKTRSHAFSDNPVIDNLLSTVVALGSELWVNRRRQLVIEKILESKGILKLEEIEAFDPDAETGRDWETQRNEFLDRLYSEMIRTGQ